MVFINCKRCLSARMAHTFKPEYWQEIGSLFLKSYWWIHKFCQQSYSCKGFSPRMVMTPARAVLIVDWIECKAPGQTLGPFFPGSIPTDSRSKGRVMVYSPWRHSPWWIGGGQHTHSPHLHPSHCPARESFQSHLRYNSLPCWGVGSAKARTFESFPGSQGGWLC